MEFDLSLTTIVVSSLFFFLSGFVDSIAGGGGLINIPILLLMGVPPHLTLGSSKFASGLGTLCALGTFLKNKKVVLRLIPTALVTGAAGGIAGSWIALQIESALMGKLLLCLLPIGLVFLLVSGALKKDRSESEDSDVSLTKGGVTGLAAGFYDGFFGPGAGSFLIIVLFSWLHMDLVRASANAKLFNLASCLAAMLTFASAGSVLYGLALPCALASIAGNYVGAKYTVKIGPKLVRMVLYGVLTLLLVNLLAKYFFFD